MLITSATGMFAAYAQTQLSPEKKKALRNFDPADMVPEARGGAPEGREGQGDRGRRKSRQNAGPSAPLSEASGISASTDPISAAIVPAAATPPTIPVAQSTPSPQATPLLTSKAKPAPAQSVAPMAQSSEPAASGPLASAAPATQSGRVTGLSLPVIFLLLGLTLLALVVVAARLKKDLRAP